MAADQAHLAQLLKGFQERDNTIRQQAEAAFNSLKQSNPDALILNLVALLGDHPETQIRQQSAISIRLVLRDFLLHRSDTLWNKLSESTKNTLKSDLLRCIQSESAARTVRRSVCDTVSELGAELLTAGKWPELNENLLQLVRSPSQVCQAAGLKIFSDLVPQLSDLIRNHIPDVARIVTTCAKAEDPEVRYECLCLVTSIVQSEPRTVWKHLQAALPDFIAGLQDLIQKFDEESAVDFMTKLIEIGESTSSFFKPHLPAYFTALLAIGKGSELEDECRQMAVEALLCVVEDRPQMCVRVPNFVSEMVVVLLELMLTIEEDPFWIDEEESREDDTTRNYDVGESGLDRLASALGENVIHIIFRNVSDYVRHEEWQYKLVGIMAISQTVEYLPENGIAEHLDEIVTLLLAQLKDSHHRVRFAACQAIGQVALDHQPLFQQTYAGSILPALLTVLDDPTPRVQSHAAAAIVNFAEEVDKADLKPFAEQLMHKLFERVSASTPRVIREPCITGIAVVAGVMEKDFMVYYPTVMPAMKEIISKATGKEDRTMCGKAVECISIIGLSVGAEVFGPDAHEVMTALLQVAACGIEADDPVKEYMQEAFCRLCRTLKGAFVPYLPHLVPGVLKVLTIEPKVVNEEDDNAEDMTLVSMAGGQYSGLKTSVIEEMAQATNLLGAFVEILGVLFVDFIVPSAQALLPMLAFPFNDDVKRSALTAMSQLLGAARELNEKNGGGDVSMLSLWISEILEQVFSDLTPDEDENSTPDVDLMVAETSGLAKCLRNAGPGVLNAQQVAGVCEKVFALMHGSSQRRAEIATRKSDPDFDDEDVEHLEDEETSEQTLRSTLLEIVAAIMSYHPDLYLQTGAALCQKFISIHIQPHCAADDRALALYVSDDVLEHLKDKGASLWPTFGERLIESINDPDACVRQAAAFGVIQAAKCSMFPNELILQAATRLVAVLNDPSSQEKANLSATDNATAALGAIVLHRSSVLQPSPQQFLDLWIRSLPLKVDDEEGRRAHGDLVDLLVRRSPEVLGPNNSNLPKLAAICASIYRTDFSTTKVDEGIREFMNTTGFEVISKVGSGFAWNLQKSLERIHRDVVTKE